MTSKKQFFVGWTSLFVLASTMSLGCRPQPAASAQEGSGRGEVLDYSFGTIDGGVESSTEHRGRVTVLLFVTTFDVLSQAAAQRLEDLYRSHAPRINALGIVLEAPQYVEFARSFRETLKLSYPLALAEIAALRNMGFLAAVQKVPAWVFLDARGRIISAGSGALSMDQLEEAVRAAQR